MRSSGDHSAASRAPEKQPEPAYIFFFGLRDGVTGPARRA